MMFGYIGFFFSIQTERVAIGGTCERNWQCNGTTFANVCDHDVCSCRPGYIQIGRKCYPGKTSRVYYDKYNFLVNMKIFNIYVHRAYLFWQLLLTSLVCIY